MDNELAKELAALDAIIQLHEELNLPTTVLLYGTKEEINQRLKWTKNLASSGVYKTRFKRTDSYFDMLQYRGYKFYYLETKG